MPALSIRNSLANFDKPKKILLSLLALRVQNLCVCKAMSEAQWQIFFAIGLSESPHHVRGKKTARASAPNLKLGHLQGPSVRLIESTYHVRRKKTAHASAPNIKLGHLQGPSVRGGLSRGRPSPLVFICPLDTSSLLILKFSHYGIR